MSEVDQEAYVIAARLMQQDIGQLSASPVFLDLYEMAKDLLLNNRRPVTSRGTHSDRFDFFCRCPTVTSR
jgi:hypothetical protein